jgi:hypothetical protein
MPLAPALWFSIPLAELPVNRFGLGPILLEEALFPFSQMLQGPSSQLPLPPSAKFCGLSSFWGGGMYRLQLPPAVSKGKLLKQRVVGLVGAECGWECSPITLVAVTTLYLVHG